MKYDLKTILDNPEIRYIVKINVTKTRKINKTFVLSVLRFFFFLVFEDNELVED